MQYMSTSSCLLDEPLHNLPEMWTICLSILSLDQSYSKNNDVHTGSYLHSLSDRCNLERAIVQTIIAGCPTLSVSF